MDEVVIIVDNSDNRYYVLYRRDLNQIEIGKMLIPILMDDGIILHKYFDRCIIINVNILTIMRYNY